MDKNFAVGCVCALLAFSAIVGGTVYYNLRTNRIYADLLKGASDPLKMKCAWGASSNICTVVVAKP